MTLIQPGVDPSKVAIYIRWSTDDQTQGTTLAVQLEGCRHYVLSQGWQSRDDLIFVDDGYSGGDTRRPALTRLRQSVQQGQVDCIVVFKLDRLSRSVVDTVKLVLEEWEGRAYLKSAREPVDTSTPHGKVLFYILASYAEWERSVIRERTHSGQLKRAQAGRNPGIRIPYGYIRGEAPGTLQIHPQEAEVVRRIFRLYNAGAGAASIVGQLHAEGVPFRRGKGWNEQTVLYLLRNPIYCGELVYGKTTRNPRYGKEPGQRCYIPRASPIHVRETPHIPPIIGQAEFVTAQAVRSHRRERQPGHHSGRANASPHLLTGVARCRCGYGLYLKVSHKGDRRYFMYACGGKKVRGAAFCSAANIPRDALDQLVADLLVQRFGGELRREEYTRWSLLAADRELAAAAAALRVAAGDRHRLAQQMQKVRRDYRSDRLSPEEFHQLQAEIAAEADGADERLRLLRGQMDRLTARKARSSGLQEYLEQADQWRALTPAERKNLAKLLVASLVAHRTPGSKDVHVDLVWADSGGASAAAGTEGLPAEG